MSLPIVCILCGGQSTEHEVSLLSAINVFSAINRSHYTPMIVGVDKDGLWRLYPDGDFCLNSGDPSAISLNPNGLDVFPVHSAKGNYLMELQSGKTHPFDVIFPVMHGANGEDGAMQGLCQILNSPCVGCDMFSSAACMDKDIAKQLLACQGIRVAAGQVLHRTRPLPNLQQLIDEYGLPIFVKPSRAGSSVGVSKAGSLEELQAAIEEAFRYDSKVLVERRIVGREIECAVLGNLNPFAAVPGEIIPKRDFYSYEAKYIDEDGATLCAPAPLTEDETAAVQKLAVDAFRILGCRGMARVDFFLQPGGTWVLNELNTIPGFTRISMFPRLMQLSGLSYDELVDKLIALSLEVPVSQFK